MEDKIKEFEARLAEMESRWNGVTNWLIKFESWCKGFDNRLCELVGVVDLETRDGEKFETMIDDLACQLNELKEKFLDWENWMERSPDNDYTGVEKRLKSLETWRSNKEKK
ncbi:MAG: hypothetical protein LBT38_12300 [Deltaproteobacteria bacterium]|jgi:uncharacterized coiled-coil protein SlyX|nr:hypothetical protein [Deltaproteobacteria bacterium]